MMPPRSAGGRLNVRSTRRKYVKRLGWLFRSKLEMRLSAWATLLVLRAMILALKRISTPFQLSAPVFRLTRHHQTSSALLVVRAICSSPLYRSVMF